MMPNQDKQQENEGQNHKCNKTGSNGQLQQTKKSNKL